MHTTPREDFANAYVGCRRRRRARVVARFAFVIVVSYVLGKSVMINVGVFYAHVERLSRRDDNIHVAINSVKIAFICLHNKINDNVKIL